MRRAPAKPVRACTLRKLCPASHVTCEAPLRTSHSTLHTSRCILRTPHFTLHTALFALQTSHFTLLTSHSTLHTPHFTLHASHFSLLSSDSTLHTSHFTRHSPHFTLLIAFFTLPTLLHSTEKLLHTASFHTQQAFTHRTLTHSAFYTWQALTHTHRNFYTEKLLHTANFYTQQAFTHSKRLHTVLAHSAFTHGKRLHTEHLHTVLLHMASVYTHTKKIHRDTFNTCTDKLLHTANFYTQHLLHTASFHTQQAFRHRTLTHSTCTQCFYTWQAFTHKLFHTGKQLQNRISTPKQKKDDFEALFKRDFKRKITSAKIAKICWQITIAAWMQPLQYDLQSSAAKDNSITHAAAAASNLEAATPMRSAETELQITIELSATASEIAAPKPDRISTPKQKQDDLKHFLKGILKGKLLAPKLRKSADKWLSQPGCSHSNTIYNLQLQKTILLRMRRQATLTQPFQCDLQAQIPKHPITTHTQAHPKQLEATVTMRQKKRQTDRSRTRRTDEVPFMSSPAAATLHGKTQGFVLRLPPENRALATSCSHSNAICKHRFQNTL